MVVCIGCFAGARLVAGPSYAQLVTVGEKDIGYIGENGEFVPFEKNQNSIDARQNIQSRPRYTAATQQIQAQQTKPTAQSLNYSDTVTVPQVDGKMPKMLNGSALGSPPWHPGVNWAQKNADNFMCGIDPVCRMSKALIPSEERISKMTTAYKRDSNALSRPNVGLISSSEVSGYPYVGRYLTELDDKDISHYYILREDYTFQDLSGGSITIPAGFIWDGASIPTSLLELALEVGNTRYNSALSEGLIHDFMYRDPRRFSQEDADDLLYVNLVRCANADPMKIYTGVRARGGEAYQGHKRRQDQGLYDVFTPEFYAGNLKTFQGGKDSSDTPKRKTESIKRKTNNVSDDSDFDVCKCAVPDDRDFQCQKCGKMSSWLAPHRDKEFEQMLKRGIK